MDRLINRDLLNAGLVRLTPHLVDRYSACLASMGIQPAEGFEELSIDGGGTSPELAKAWGNPHYLCNGLANPLAVILCPEQYNRPVYFPIFSWQRSLMRALFDKYHREIIDVSGTHAIAVELENGLSTFEDPRDLFLLTEIVATPHVEELAEAAGRQAALIGAFANDHDCLDETLGDRIVESRKAHGDLRKRRVAMEPITFSSFADFYTVAFGGAAVLRNVDGVDFLILEDQKLFDAEKHHKRKGERVFHLFDPDFGLFNALKRAGWVRVPLDKYRADPKLIGFKRELLIADALCDCEEGVNWRKLNVAARTQLVQKHEEKVPAIYPELERFGARLRRGGAIHLSQELEHFLAEPGEHLPPQTQEVLWTLLTKREPRNLLSLYTADKNAFLARYAGWSDQRREWAADYIVDRYRHKHRMEQK